MPVSEHVVPVEGDVEDPEWDIRSRQRREPLDEELPDGNAPLTDRDEGQLLGLAFIPVDDSDSIRESARSMALESRTTRGFAPGSGASLRVAESS